MTEFIVPNIFTAGTKAKACEVNENFSAIKTQFDAQQSEINSNITSISNLENYVEGTFKNEITAKISEVKENRTKFCVNSCYDELLVVNDIDHSQLDFNVDSGSMFKPLVVTNVKGETFTFESVESLDFSDKNDGCYNIFIDEEGVASAYLNTIYRQITEPSEKHENDIWFDISKEPLKAYKYENSEWIEFGGVNIGSVVVASYVITSINQPILNQNGYNINLSTQGYRLPDYKRGINRTTANTWLKAEQDCFVAASFSLYTNAGYTVRIKDEGGNLVPSILNEDTGTVFYSQLPGTPGNIVIGFFVPAGYSYNLYWRDGSGNLNKCLEFPLKGVN